MSKVQCDKMSRHAVRWHGGGGEDATGRNVFHPAIVFN